ncbi:MAG: glucoamylase, partial [Rhodospirillaceae bacterium]|nr:glucoamylase [Rhodospirillaceae bacterium]
MNSLDLAIIGNCAYSALIDPVGRIVWSCLPHFDGDPAMNALLNNGAEDGVFEVTLEGLVKHEQRYLHNTPILLTRLEDAHGGAVEIVDFAPRFKHFGRIYRAPQIFRRITRIAGLPRVCIRLRPTFEYGAVRPQVNRGSNHIRYATEALTLRLTTDGPVSYILDEVAFPLEGTVNMILGHDESLTQSIADTVREFEEKTADYWREWARYLSIPFEWQEAVIRAAITLKLCSFEETGAIIAAATTSIPEAIDSGRNWDYRYCWLRDAYFVVHALNRLGATKTMEDHLRYIGAVVSAETDGALKPLYSINLGKSLEERIAADLGGYRGMGPVRVGNAAYTQLQNDVYGSVILASSQAFFDQRLINPGGAALFERLEPLGDRAVACFDQPDAGPWELRGRVRVHTYSSVMCWAACDRLAKIGARLGLVDRADFWRAHADRMRSVVLEEAWDPKQETLVESFGGSDIDASVLLVNTVGFLEADDPRFVKTVAAVEKGLKRGRHLLRYAGEDDFGVPQTSFTTCTFWYIDAIGALGRTGEAREMFEE